MGQVRVNINGRSYPLTCKDGEENHLRQLGTHLDAVVRNLVERAGGKTGRISDTHIMVMAGLMVADELSDAYKKLQAAGGEAAAGEGGGLAEALDGLAARLENVALRLESA
jgi:cell division protein ZapA